MNWSWLSSVVRRFWIPAVALASQPETHRPQTQATDDRNPAASLSSAAAQTFKPRDDRSQEKRHETEETKRTQQ